MSLPRLRLEKCSYKDERWLIDQEQAHHLVRVRRCCTGSLAEGLLLGEIVQLRLLCEGELVFAEELSRTVESAPSIELHLVLGLLKSDQFDQALRFAAETGVHTIHLLTCERSVPRYSAIKLKGKMLRWDKILDEATRQAGSATPPVLLQPVTLKELDPFLLPDCRFAAMLSPDADVLSKTLITSPAAIAIGPEGDWSHSEIELLLEKNFKPVNLGKRILRASTAVAVACGWFSMN
ncbi:MAG: 16S rRNA (uracil(1498)-N(3))-methyltransferase [Synergistaceae bacterium]|nr:16S rRNA (uracil(1498)-N(3))-methyltransferase [Synergistaceae bacterium]